MSHWATRSNQTGAMAANDTQEREKEEREEEKQEEYPKNPEPRHPPYPPPYFHDDVLSFSLKPRRVY